MYPVSLKKKIPPETIAYSDQQWDLLPNILKTQESWLYVCLFSSCSYTKIVQRRRVNSQDNSKALAVFPDIRKQC